MLDGELEEIEAAGADRGEIEARSGRDRASICARPRSLCRSNDLRNSVTECAKPSSWESVGGETSCAAAANASSCCDGGRQCGIV